MNSKKKKERMGRKIENQQNTYIGKIATRTKCHSWLRTEQSGSRPDTWVPPRCLERAGIWCLGWRVLLYGPRMTMLRRCEGGLRNDEFHKLGEDAGSSSWGHCRGYQCPHDDHSPCFSHRASSPRGVTSVTACKNINTSTTLTSWQWEPTTYQLIVTVPVTPSQTPPFCKKPH